MRVRFSFCVMPAASCAVVRTYSYLTSPSPLPFEECLLLMLIRLRLAWSFDILADTFRVDRKTASGIFIRCLVAVRACFEATIVRPVDASTLEDDCVIEYVVADGSPVTHIADSSLVQLERPHNHRMDGHSYSSYMSMHSAKVLVSIGRNAHVNFVSGGFGGAASDAQVAAASAFYDAASNGVVMFDKGGVDMREPLLQVHSRLITPSIVTGKFLSLGELTRNGEISHDRVHIERAIERIKRFAVLDGPFPSSMLYLFDEMVFVCAYLTHFMGPLIKRPSVFPPGTSLSSSSSSSSGGDD